MSPVEVIEEQEQGQIDLHVPDIGISGCLDDRSLIVPLTCSSMQFVAGVVYSVNRLKEFMCGLVSNIGCSSHNALTLARNI